MEVKSMERSNSKIVVVMTMVLVFIAICINVYIIIRGVSNDKSSQTYSSMVQNIIKDFNEKEELFNEKGNNYLQNLNSLNDSAIDEMTQIVYAQGNDIEKLRNIEAENELYEEQTELIYLYNQTNSINLTLVSTFLLKDEEMIIKGFNEKKDISENIKETEDKLLEKITMTDIDYTSNELIIERSHKSEEEAILGCWINMVDETRYYFSKDKLYKVNEDEKQVIKYTIESYEDGYLLLKLGSNENDKMQILFDDKKSEINIKYKKDGVSKYEVLNYLREDQRP